MVDVFVQVDGEDILAGYLTYNRDGRGGGTGDDDGESRFVYDEDYYGHQRAYDLSPDLPRRGGTRHRVRGLPVAFRDASPDFWGSHLLDKAERARAFTETRPPQRLNAFDRLCGASDITRQGAIRFRDGLTGPFLAEGVEVPKTLELATLLAAADEVSTADDWAAAKRLLDAGTGSLGGARPKAAVTADGDLWLAKFPAIGDKNDVPLWEMLSLDIAHKAGIDTPEHKLVDLGGRNVLLVKRFDRDGATRVGYASLRTMANNRDHGLLDYTDIIDILVQHSLNPADEVRMALRHAALDVALNNTDNHERNHGFLQVDRGWKLSPIFDLDPNPDTGAERGTGIGGSLYRGNSTLGLTRLAEHAGIDKHEACRIVGDVLAALDGWPARARDLGASEVDINAFTAGLDNADLRAYAGA